MKRYPLTASQRITMDFSLLDTERATKKYNLKKIDVYGEIIYVSSQQDEWYIKKTGKTTIELWHRNRKRSQKEFHREKKSFEGVIEVLKYIQHHDKKIFALGHRGIYTKTRMEVLFEQIERSKKGISKKNIKKYK